jgi:SAM-dependent methyltransferase
MRAVLPQLRAEDTVLDIGAGTGRYALYLAGRVARVIALEPSAAMRAQLAERLAETPLANLSVVAAAWPMEEAPVCDVALAAHVTYSVRQIGPFLRGMSAAARRACFLAVGVRPPSFVTAPFWERVYGEPRLPLPGAVECLGALRQLGIHALVTLLPTPPYSFADADEALADLRERLYLPAGSQRDEVLRQAITELLAPDEDGRLVPREPALPTAAILWAPPVV